MNGQILPLSFSLEKHERLKLYSTQTPLVCHVSHQQTPSWRFFFSALQKSMLGDFLNGRENAPSPRKEFWEIEFENTKRYVINIMLELSFVLFCSCSCRFSCESLRVTHWNKRVSVCVCLKLKWLLHVSLLILFIFMDVYSFVLLYSSNMLYLFY